MSDVHRRITEILRDQLCERGSDDAVYVAFDNEILHRIAAILVAEIKPVGRLVVTDADLEDYPGIRRMT